MSIKITWYGHATLALEIDGQKIIVDPYFTDNPAATISAEAVSADYILVTHGHFDQSVMQPPLQSERGVGDQQLEISNG
jgi:L-ascorbate metabolism protein UlaG (beta-lactamase superfamily)